MSQTIAGYVDDLMIKIPGGMVRLRDDRIKTRWMAPVNTFLLARFPVTMNLYSAIVHKAPLDLAGDTRPVVDVNWYEAMSFCNLLSAETGLREVYSLRKDTDGDGDGDGDEIICDWEAGGYRLPTEAEWQYACMAGTAGYRYSELDKIAWYNGNSSGTIHAVGQKEPNCWGLHDMLGNVWEWCWDIYDANAYGEYRILRGGSWADEARSCGASCRRRSHPSFMIDDLGFRIAKSQAFVKK